MYVGGPATPPTTGVSRITTTPTSVPTPSENTDLSTSHQVDQDVPVPTTTIRTQSEGTYVCMQLHKRCTIVRTRRITGGIYKTEKGENNSLYYQSIIQWNMSPRLGVPITESSSIYV